MTKTFFKRIFLLTTFFTMLFFASTRGFSADQNKDTDKTSLHSQYSFDNMFDNGKLKPKRHFSIATYYNMNYMQIPNLFQTLNGWGINLEGFITNWASVFFSFNDSYGKSRHVVIDWKFFHKDQQLSFRSDILNLGTKFYFGIFYMGIGVSVNFLRVNEKDGSSLDIKHSPDWDMFLQLGINFPLYKGLSLDTGINVAGGLGETFGMDMTAGINYYLGLKYTV